MQNNTTEFLFCQKSFGNFKKKCENKNVFKDFLLASGLGNVEKPSGTVDPNRIIKVLKEIDKYVGYLTVFVLVAAGILLTLFAVYVGYRLAVAEDETKRKDAKNQLIYSILALVGVICIVAVMKDVWQGFLQPEQGDGKHYKNLYDIGIGEEYLNLITVTNVIVKMALNAGIVFAMWVGWQVMKAEDESKRRNAKLQMLYTVVGIVVAVFLISIFNGTFDAIFQTGNKKTN
jgi:heme/copper-type cytochrome/quinol oxidase subunit 2